MTILTKSTDKKKLLPIPTAPLGAPSEGTSDAEAAAIIHARRKAGTTTLLVFLMAVLVLLMGVLAGVCFYRQYLRQRVQRLNCYIPYNDDVDRNENFWVNTQWRDGPTFSDSLKSVRDDDDDSDDESSESFRNMIQQLFAQLQREFNDPMKEIKTMESEISSLNAETIPTKFFREQLEIRDDDSESYADIKIPDFKDGRRGRFVHDFKNNQTTIVDEEAKRCFIYPLDYQTTLPPQSMFDIFAKMQSGYYFPDTNVLRKKMRVVLPELEHDDDYVSPRSAYICSGMKIYQLEPFVSGVFKRSIGEKISEHATFAEFAGRGIVTVDFMNLNEVVEYEHGDKVQ